MNKEVKMQQWKNYVPAYETDELKRRENTDLIRSIAEQRLQLPVEVEAAPIQLKDVELTEATNPVERAKAVSLRLGAFSITWLALSGAVIYVAGLGWVWTIVVWGVLTILSYAYLNWQEYSHSNAGIHRHYIDREYNLREQVQEDRYKLTLYAMQMYQEILTNGYERSATESGPGRTGRGPR